MTKGLLRWAAIIYRHAGLIVLLGLFMLALSVMGLRKLSLSTDINALMPEGAKSVETLENALEMIGSYSSIQVVIGADDPAKVIETAEELKAEFDKMEWVESAKFYEDVEVLIRHELLFLSEDELIELEKDVYQSLAIFFAKEMSETFNTDAVFTLGTQQISGRSDQELDPERVDQFEKMFSKPPSERRYFVSEDQKTAVMVVTPKPGQTALSDAKMMVQGSHELADRFQNRGDQVSVGITGRIASQVGQYDALMRDLKFGLGSALLLISLILLFSFRTMMAIPLIIIPLSVGIMATLAITAVTIGQLNLITAFLTLILFGLGIDFGIHNFARYVEERRAGTSLPETIAVLVERTGRASFMAAVTTAASFYALTQTQFRAFSEFGFIAGTGIVLAFIFMYSLFPAILVLSERLGWSPKVEKREPKSRHRGRSLFALRHPRFVVLCAIMMLSAACFFAPKILFETNTKNLEATMSERYETAKLAAKDVLGDSSWAVLVADTYEDLIGVEAHFTEKKNQSDDTTIKQVRSLLSFVPPPDVQQRRLDIIRRLKDQADRLQGLAPDKYEAGKEYLSIETMSVAALPPLVKRTYMGDSQRPGYLYYIYPNVNMADSSEAGRFYRDAANIEVDGKAYFSASESFVLVEMLGMMQADAWRAVLLVTLTTVIVVFLFFRNLSVTLIVLVPPLCGVLLTLGFMGMFGPALSIMNMVILPSLIGISVDNGIHIVHRFVGHRPRPDLGYIMLTTGKAALLTTLTTLIGFGGMITASVGGLRSLALLAIIGFAFCLMMTWFLLPAILQLLDNKAEPNVSESLMA